MVLAPSAAYAGSILVDGSTILGATNVKLTDKTSMVEITSLGDSAVKRYPTIGDATLSFDLIFDHADTGQAKIFTSKTNKTTLAYIVRLDAATHYYTFASGYVETLDATMDPGQVVKFSVTISVSGGTAFTG